MAGGDNARCPGGNGAGCVSGHGIPATAMGPRDKSREKDRNASGKDRLIFYLKNSLSDFH